jgi:hypothetical protein
MAVSLLYAAWPATRASVRAAIAQMNPNSSRPMAVTI